ncbi:hypothetical protein [Lactobacillus delbrueckii]|uniref:hypothetical protein n=1 Tax=Lactobacillus delbrueckii TaxID=1584 RepID=UPI001E35C718|nr:hypothetical protein [Lactobacillus delbrueckii]
MDVGADRADSDGSRLALGRLSVRSQAQDEEGGNDDDEGDGGGDEPLLLFLSSYDFCS